MLGPLRQSPPNKWVAALWSGVLAVLPLTLGIVMLAGGAHLGGGVPRLLQCCVPWRAGQRPAEPTPPR